MDPATATALTLTVEKGPRMGESVECRPGDRVRIGRVIRGNTLVIRDPGISHAHLSIESPAGGGGWAVTDLGSSNGTFLNGVQIEPSVPAPLRDGDTIKIGERTTICVRVMEVELSALQPVAGRGCASGAAEAPLEGAGGGARRRGRSRRATASEAAAANTHVDGRKADGGGEEESGLAVKESVKKPKKNTSGPRGRGARKKAAAAAPPRVLDSVPEEYGKEDLVVPGASDCNVLKEVKQEISDSVPIHSVKGARAGLRRGRSSARGATTAAVVLEEGQVRVEEDDRDSPLREEEQEDEEVAVGVNPGAVEGPADMESMTLEQWFDRMDKYLPKVINEIAEEIISEIRAKAEKFNEYVGNNLKSEQRVVGDGVMGLR